jgi:hypothetical protein
MPNIGHGRDGEYSGMVAICLKEASFHFRAASFQFRPKDLRSIRTKPVWFRAVP